MSENSQNTKAESNFQKFLKSVWEFLDDLIDLQDGMDRKGTIQNIKNNKKMRGANAWLLMCSIMIASLGLDLNSPAVIIGAMLISPLMSPILGVGLGVGINDRETLYISIQHFGVSIVIALLTSTLYFWLTPFGNIGSEIEARTSPNTLDAMVAFFGGIAGIISGSRIDKSNAIPGVAIATALMPPLCVTGFGIANGNWEYMIKSFYLFFLNATLVALATFLIVRLLRFPMKQYETIKEKRKMRNIIFIFSILITLPSLYILADVYQEVRFKQRAADFLKEFTGDKYGLIDNWESEKRDSTNRILIKVYGNKKDFFTEREMETALPNYEIENNTKIEILTTSELDMDDYKKLESQITDVKDIAAQLETEKATRSNNEILIDSLRQAIEQEKSDTLPVYQMCEELRAAFPDINKVTFAKAQESNEEKLNNMPILIIDWKQGTTPSSKRRDKPRIDNFVRTRISLDTLRILD